MNLKFGIPINTIALSNLSLRGAKRRGNLDVNDEIASPSARNDNEECHKRYCVCISLSVFLFFFYSSASVLHSAEYKSTQTVKPALVPLPPITVGVYISTKDRYPQIGRVRLYRGKKYVIEAKCKVAKITQIGSSVTFRMDSKYGLEYFEVHGVPAGSEISVPWEYDGRTQSCVAKVGMSADTMTTIFKTDKIIVTSEGAKEGKLEFEVLPPAATFNK